MESFDAEGEDKRGQQVLSTELHNKVVEAFEVFDHENNKTVCDTTWDFSTLKLHILRLMSGRSGR